MKQNMHKVFWGFLLLLTAAALILGGMNESVGLFGIPLHKLILAIVLVAWIFSKVFFGKSLRERFKVFFPLGLLFIVLESEIAAWAGLADSNIINNWIVILAAILADIAISILIPRSKKRKPHFFSINNSSDYGAHESDDRNCFGEKVIYIDASRTTKSYVMNKLGETNVYYQNSDRAPDGTVFELTVENMMGETTVHVPSDWVIRNEMTCSLGEINTRNNPEGETKLIVRGHNKMGETNII